MKFVDRTQEKERLTKILNMDRPTFTAIYGRRRLGKSALITRVITDTDIYYLADESEASAQKFAGFDKVTYPDWETLFRSVNYRTEEKFTPELPSVLKKLIDKKGLKYNLVVCGSSQNMMYGLILDESSPLYGRADVVMKFTPIKLPYLQEALDLTAVQAIEEYSVWGGVPRYWELREMHNSLDEAIWTEALSVNGTLYDEPVKLFKDDVQDIVKTATIMSFVGVGANRISEIASRSNEPATNLSRPIKKLIDLGFLDKEKKPHQIELDVVAESLDKKKILIGECKWTSGEDAVALENELRWKASMLPFAKGKEVVPVIFTKNITNKSESSLTKAYNYEKFRKFAVFEKYTQAINEAPMKYIATILLFFMTIALVTSGVILWKRRKETGDYSRFIWAVFSWISAFFTLTFIMRTWQETTTSDGAFFEPEHTFVPLLMQMTFLLYPLELIRPTLNKVKVYVLLFTPLILLVSVGMCAGIEYTPIYTYADLWQHIGEFNVWFRLLTLTVMLFYCFSLFLVPYDWRKSSADKKFITFYSCGFCLIGLLHFSVQMSHAYFLVLAHQIVWISFFLSVTWYELRERLLLPKAAIELKEFCDCDSTDDDLWREITLLLNNNDKWRDPNLSLSYMSELLESNRTYVGEAFKRNTGMTFIEYLTKRRIDYVVARIKDNPKADIHELFNHVGYRQRSTSWRNFQKITGMTPTEFIDNLK